MKEEQEKQIVVVRKPNGDLVLVNGFPVRSVEYKGIQIIEMKEQEVFNGYDELFSVLDAEEEA